MLTSAIKKADICLLFYLIKSVYGISNLESWRKKNKEKGKQFHC